MNFHLNRLDDHGGGYRDDLAAIALAEIDHLNRLSRLSKNLSHALSPFKEPEEFLQLVNQLAYAFIEHLVPEYRIESTQDDLIETPISADDVKRYLDRPIRYLLKNFES